MNLDEFLVWRKFNMKGEMTQIAHSELDSAMH